MMSACRPGAPGAVQTRALGPVDPNTEWSRRNGGGRRRLVLRSGADQLEEQPGRADGEHGGRNLAGASNLTARPPRTMTLSTGVAFELPPLRSRFTSVGEGPASPSGPATPVLPRPQGPTRRTRSGCRRASAGVTPSRRRAGGRVEPNSPARAVARQQGEAQRAARRGVWRAKPAADHGIGVNRRREPPLIFQRANNRRRAPG
jgi:hypothetical protein